MYKIKNIGFWSFFLFLLSSPVVRAEEVTVVATESIFIHLLMGLAGCIVAGLFWFGIIKNI